MNSILRITDPILKDDSIDRYEEIVYEPVAGTNLNAPGQDIRLTIETQDIFTHPSESFLIVEGRLLKTNNNSYGNDDLISLTNNGIMHLFKRIRYDLSGQEIETLVHPGQATTMLGLLKYADDFSKSKGLNQLWYKDTTGDPSIDDNAGFSARQAYIIRNSDPKGLFSFRIPLKHIFGFCEDYDKVVYGLKHNLTLTRNDDNDAIFRAANNADGSAVAIGKVILSKVSWFMPHVTPADKDKMELYKIIERKEKIPVGYRMIQCELMVKENNLNMEGIEYPVSLKDINKFEKQNLSISITVLGYDGKDIYPLRNSKCVDRKHNITLMLIEENEVKHYCLVKSTSRLLSSQTTKGKRKEYFCLRCLNPFWCQEALSKHQENCGEYESVKIELPKEGTMLKFKNYFHAEKVPFIIYADTEALIKNIQNCNPNPEKSYTKKYQKHEPISFSYYIKCFNDNVYEPRLRSYTGVDAMEIFVKWVEEDVKEIANIPKVNMVFNKEEAERFNKATKCWICKEDLNDDKVRDHCHFTGRYRGAAHNSCNLKYKKPKFIPVVFHNLSGYDSHLFIKNLGFTAGNIDCIPNNEEKYISFTKNIMTGSYMNKKGEIKPISYKLRFIDSFKFMSTSLDTLVNNLPDEAFNNLKRYYKGDKLSLVKRKGVYPYEYMDSMERFEENKLPPKEAFYSRLMGEGISNEDYKHAKKVWDVFEMKTLQDYHDLYNETDVLLLADVFENFRNICLKNYKLDPAHYFTAPGLAWDACLKMTGVNLELLSDIDMLLMIEKGIRGGVSMISNRYGKANNKYMGKSFIDTLISTYIAYLDANNLYGWAMSKPLPTHGFKWMKVDELETWELHSCILEVDLEYPKSLHDLHNDYPLAPEQIVVNKVSKLIRNLGDKKKYILHYENLKQYLRLGLKLTHIHRGIKFKESPWLEKYISLNTKLRPEAKNEFEKDFFKLMNNSVFGKTMENIRNRVDIKLVDNKKQAEKLSAKPNFKHCNIFSEDLVAIHMKKTKLVFNKPVYLGMCILDLSKTLMYDFHYNYIKQKYGDKAKLLLTDTDSLMYEIQTEDFYKDISGDVKNRFDTSDYPPDHPSGIPSGFNKKVLGMFKDEVNGNVIDEFVGLRAKLYSYKMFEGEESKKCKGVKKSVVKEDITHEDYKKCLTDRKPQLRKMNIIRSYKHNVFTEEVNKVALCSNDDKRYILEDGKNTLALKHYRIL